MKIRKAQRLFPRSRVEAARPSLRRGRTRSPKWSPGTGSTKSLKTQIRWLSMRLNRGELRGVRFGRVWRMRRSDIEFMLERYSNDGKVKPHPALDPMPEPTSLAAGVSRRSRRLRGMA